MQALDDPIEITPDDTEEEVEIKKQMIELKAQISQAIKNGDDPIALIREALDERNRAATYRENMLDVLAAEKKAGAAPEELAEMREAANKLLEEKGVKLLRTAAQIKANFAKKRLEREQEESK